MEENFILKESMMFNKIKNYLQDKKIMIQIKYGRNFAQRYRNTLKLLAESEKADKEKTNEKSI